MDFVTELQRYTPQNKQEEADKTVILDFAAHNASTVLSRGNAIAHITSSGFVMNPGCTRVLLAHHNIRNAWAWAGGHADGDADLLAVALREAKEETGVVQVAPQTGHIASVDILPVYGHTKNGGYVTAHLHLSIAYILLCDETQPTAPKWDENSGVAWFDTGWFNSKNLSPEDVYLYNKLIRRAQQAAAGT